jgi:hypothetical protein
MPAPYSNIQFLAYEVYTGPALNEAKKKSYLGLPNAVDDIKARCDLMKRAMARALQLSGPADPSTLKVFMAPEFYFRGANGAYLLSETTGTGAYVEGASVDLIGMLQDHASDPDYADWMFVFGTILSTPDPAPVPAPNADPKPAPPVAVPLPLREVYNFSLVQAGGPDNSKGKGARIVMKKFKSHIDFIKQENAANPTPLSGPVLFDQAVQHPTPYEPRWSLTELELGSVVGAEQQQSDEDGGGIFDCQGVTFGMEICLDHLWSRLWQVQLPGQRMVQVQLVPSGGASIDDVNVIVGPGGMVFACDGMNSGAGIRPAALALQQGKKVVPVNLDADAKGADATAAALLFPPYLPQTPASGRIYAYPKAPIPAVTQVPGQMHTLLWDFRGGDITFSLIYDATGKLSAARCRMGSKGGNKNRLLYNIPLPGRSSPVAMTSMTYVYPEPADGTKRVGSILVGAMQSSDGFYEILCNVMLETFQFRGTVLRLSANIANPQLQAVDGVTVVP